MKRKGIILAESDFEDEELNEEDDLLLKNGANVSHRDNAGSSSLDLARANHQTEITERLERLRE